MGNDLAEEVSDDYAVLIYEPSSVFPSVSARRESYDGDTGHIATLIYETTADYLAWR